MKPLIVCGVSPILMMRADGGLRIIHTCGRVEFVQVDAGADGTGWNGRGCTSASTQREAYNRSVDYDQSLKNVNENYYKWSSFLGYL